nr:hypothetical protein [Candidatus Sigynarchaeota archaeon]
MENAYKLSAEIVCQEKKSLEGMEAKRWQKANKVTIIVIPGEYDTVEIVLDSLDLEYETRDPGDFDELALNNNDIVIINCPGKGFSDAGLATLKNHVAGGGLVITTDWALKHVVQRAFPGFIEHNGLETSTPFVDVRVTDTIVDYLKDLVAPGTTPRWWLEEGSYPIRILNSNVRRILTSQEMKSEYQDPTIACIIHFGKGQVMHMTSHLFLENAAPLDSEEKSALPDLLQNWQIDQKTRSRILTAIESGMNYKAIEAAYVLENLLVRVLENHVKTHAKKAR